jgi:cyclic pyranopterin phosphate synthase
MSVSPHAVQPLLDRFGRAHTYLRISLTERCNLRCTYCMPEEGVPLLGRQHYMTADEVLALARIFVRLGVDKIRLTGGEPLVRKDFSQIAQGLAALRMLSPRLSLSLTTNGILLEPYWDLLEACDIRSINISLDTLQPAKFLALTKRDEFEAVRRAIDEGLQRQFRVKVNAVLLKGKNEDEIEDFIAWSAREPVHVRFIEFMPFNGNEWGWDQILPFHTVLERAGAHFTLEKVADDAHDTARAYRVQGGQGTFGIIASMTAPFCDTCNRIRLTADGKIRNCLFSDDELDLLSPLRQGENVEMLIRQSIHAKHARHGGVEEISRLSREEFTQRSMIRIGG